MRIFSVSFGCFLWFGAAGCLNETPTSAGSQEFGPGVIVGAQEDEVGLIDVTIEPVNPPEIRNACYSILVTSGNGRVVSGNGPGAVSQSSQITGTKTRTLCASGFGDLGTPGRINFVVPCDPEAPTHKVTVWVDALCESGDADLDGTPNWSDGPSTICSETPGYINPCGVAGCSKLVTCSGGTDVEVSFELVIGQ